MIQIDSKKTVKICPKSILGLTLVLLRIQSRPNLVPGKMGCETWCKRENMAGFYQLPHIFVNLCDFHPVPCLQGHFEPSCDCLSGDFKADLYYLYCLVFSGLVLSEKSVYKLLHLYWYASSFL